MICYFELNKENKPDASIEGELGKIEDFKKKLLIISKMGKLKPDLEMNVTLHCEYMHYNALLEDTISDGTNKGDINIEDGRIQRRHIKLDDAFIEVYKCKSYEKDKDYCKKCSFCVPINTATFSEFIGGDEAPARKGLEALKLLRSYLLYIQKGK